MKVFRTPIMWLLVLAIAAAPLMPVMASLASPDAAHAHHSSEMNPAHHQSTMSDLADSADAPANDCAKHNACDGTCCGACAQCATAAVTFMSDSVPLISVQTPVIPMLHAHTGLWHPIRPPQTSL